MALSKNETRDLYRKRAKRYDLSVQIYRLFGVKLKQYRQDTVTIASLRTSVQHAADEGHIDNQGFTRRLIAKLDAAQAALDREQAAVAVNVLEAFIRELDAQAGKHIGAEHAAHLQMHAQDVIAALSR